MEEPSRIVNSKQMNGFLLFSWSSQVEQAMLPSDVTTANGSLKLKTLMLLNQN